MASRPASRMSVQNRRDRGHRPGQDEDHTEQAHPGALQGKETGQEQGKEELEIDPDTQKHNGVESGTGEDRVANERSVALSTRAEPQAVDHRPDDEDEEEHDVGKNQDYAPRRFQ